MPISKQPSTEIRLITGYLGSGKTTTIKQLLETCSEDQKVAVLVNETAEHALDGDELSGYGYPVVQLSNGCVCCDKRGELEEAIRQILQDHDPDVLYIETTGVAHPQPLIKFLNGMEAGQKSMITVIDANRHSQTGKLGKISRQQIANSSAVIIAKTDLAGDIDELRREILKIRPEAAVFEKRPSHAELSAVPALSMHGTSAKNVSHPERSITIEADPALERIHQTILEMPCIRRAKGVTRGVWFHYSTGIFDQTRTDEQKNVAVFIGDIRPIDAVRIIWTLRPENDVLKYILRHATKVLNTTK